MSWSLYAVGGRKKVASIIQQQSELVTRQGPETENAKQCAAVAAVLLDQVNRLAATSGSDVLLVRATASGSLHSGYGGIRVELSQLQVALDDPEPVASVPQGPVALIDAPKAPIELPAVTPTTPAPATVDQACPDCGTLGGEHTRGCARF